MDWTLRRNDRWLGAQGPVVLAILDGVGEGAGDAGDAVARAYTPVLTQLRSSLYTSLTAHGAAVGLPSEGDMGNSEVGHNALGCGQIHEQGAALVGNAIASGSLFSGAVWEKAMMRCGHGGALHLISLLSDGNVHSHIDHLLALIRKGAAGGAKSIYVHALLDGRDVPPTSAMKYVETLERELADVRSQGIQAQVASGGGRMTTTMDRYEADWSMVERGFHAHVHGRAEHYFGSLGEAIRCLRAQSPGIGDQQLPTFVIQQPDGLPVATMKDGDAVILGNFRGDRAVEICQAFDNDDFTGFDRGTRPQVFFAGLMEYDGDLRVPRNYLVAPPVIDETMGEYLARNRVSQLAISETQKYGHVTFFWNGNRSGKFDEKSETYVEIPSDTQPFEQRPWMKAAEITDRLIAELRSGKHRFARVNYANGDMVGHTGNLEATITAVQVLDLQLERLRRVIRELNGILVVTADHGNADEMYQCGANGDILCDDDTGSPVVKTSHTLNPVPFMIYDPNERGQYRLAPRTPKSTAGDGPGLANVMATCIELLGFVPPAHVHSSLLRF